MTGLGYRRDMAETWANPSFTAPDFMEVAPENWMNVGGYWKKQFDKVRSRFPLFCHGLSLSIGGPDPIDRKFVHRLKSFLDQNEVVLYSEHLSFSSAANAHLFDLLPIPFVQQAVDHVVNRIDEVQTILKRPLILENVSYYTSVASELSEIAFITQILKKSGAGLLLDVNNVFVNAFNHQYNPHEFIQALPLDQVSYIHMAGHEQVSEDLIIDTHGENIIPDVYELFEFTLNCLQRPVPVLLERDFNIPEENEILHELSELKRIQKTAYNYETA